MMVVVVMAMATVVMRALVALMLMVPVSSTSSTPMHASHGALSVAMLQAPLNDRPRAQ